MDKDLLNGFLSGSVNGLSITQGFLLGAAVLVEIPMIMVLLSRILRYKANRVANLVAAAIMTIVQIGTLFMGRSTMYYWFCSVFEIAATASIFYIAWRWRETEEATR
jgi:cyanate permease